MVPFLFISRNFRFKISCFYLNKYNYYLIRCSGILSLDHLRELVNKHAEGLGCSWVFVSFGLSQTKTRSSDK